jgi:hypothetical protein
METVTSFVEREGPCPPPGATRPVSAQSLSAAASYLLSEEGRKVSLLMGGNGQALQEITLQVPTNRLHLVTVDKQGVARLKLRPRFERDGERPIVRIDAAPLYDAPPSIDDLYRAAAKNHELENAYYGERLALRSKRTDDERTRRETIAQTFMADKGQRAIAHPPPSTKRCYVLADGGRVLFDVAIDQGVAKEVPTEAHRRFRSDLRVRGERNRLERAAQLARHEDKRRYIAEWIAEHGTDEQKIRQAAGMLPIDEAVESITDKAFAVLGQRAVYQRDGVERLQTLLRKSSGDPNLKVAPSDIAVRSVNAVKATAAQWAMVRDIQSSVPDATVVLRQHVLSSKYLPGSASLTIFGVLVTKSVIPFTLRREYACDDADDRASHE